MAKKYKSYGTKFSKGVTVHKTKASAKKIALAAHSVGIPYHIRKLKDGYRVDKKY
jgi:hypothetical protein